MGKEPCNLDNAMTGLKACITDDTRRTVSKIIRTGREGLCIVQSGMCTGRADLYRRASQLHPQHIAAVMEYIVKTTLCPVKGGHTHCDEIGLPVSATGGVVPCGATSIWEK